VLAGLPLGGVGVPGGIAVFGAKYCTYDVTVLNVFNGIPAILSSPHYCSANMYGVMIANRLFWKVRPDSVPVF